MCGGVSKKSWFAVHTISRSEIIWNQKFQRHSLEEMFFDVTLGDFFFFVFKIFGVTLKSNFFIIFQEAVNLRSRIRCGAMLAKSFEIFLLYSCNYSFLLSWTVTLHLWTKKLISFFISALFYTSNLSFVDSLFEIKNHRKIFDFDIIALYSF